MHRQTKRCKLSRSTDQKHNTIQAAALRPTVSLDGWSEESLRLKVQTWYTSNMCSTGTPVCYRENVFEILETRMKTCLKVTETPIKTCRNIGSRNCFKPFRLHPWHGRGAAASQNWIGKNQEWTWRYSFEILLSLNSQFRFFLSSTYFYLRKMYATHYNNVRPIQSRALLKTDSGDPKDEGVVVRCIRNRSVSLFFMWCRRYGDPRHRSISLDWSFI